MKRTSTQRRKPSVSGVRLGALILLALSAALTACSSRVEYEPRMISQDPAEAAAQNREIESQVTSTEVPDEMQVTLWASETFLGDPVGMDMDNLGRAWVTVTHRSTSSEFDVRGHRDWIPHSLTWTDVEDRRAFLHEELAPEKSEENVETVEDFNEDSSHDWRDLTVQKEEVYVIEDSSGDGVAEHAHRYLRDFHDEITDVLGSVLYDDRTGDVFAAVAPDLWRLRDNDGDGLADFKESISNGYGIHIGFSGHGMSGLKVGPDGKIYWGIGDISANITDKSGKKWDQYTNQGIVVRANPDGSDFEIFAHGVRNTHEFDFDKYGNLISVDNDGDHAGESERLVYLINGSDSGWRNNWQFGKYSDPKNNTYKVWMDEEYFKPRFEGQTALILPPVALYHSGPAGFVYNPGTALSDRWNDHFFVNEFVGSTRSAVHAFKLKQNGASFDLEETTVIQRGILGTSMDFGPDGALYVADWIEGWGTNGKGRIWKIDTPATRESVLRKQTEQLLNAGFADRDNEELLRLLGHPDMRVRQQSQFELVTRGDEGYQMLVDATDRENRLARIHGIWGIGQLARNDLRYAEPLVELLQDEDHEMRAQAAKVIGDEGYQTAAGELIPLLTDEDPRARLYAAQALGQLQYKPAIRPILDMLEANNDEDAYLRQAGAIALARIGDPEPLVALHEEESRALRIAGVIALNRMNNPGLSEFLHDEDRYIVTDAARAIADDKFVEGALPALASLLDNNPFQYEPLTRRIINANLYVGTAEAAERVAAYASRTDAPENMRIEAIRTLSVWTRPSDFDRVTGLYRGPIERDPAIVREAVQPVVAGLYEDTTASVRAAAATLTGRLDLQGHQEQLLHYLEQDLSPQVRIAAVEALSELGYGSMNVVMQTALSDDDIDVRMTALGMVPKLRVPDDEKVDLLASVLLNGTTEEQQTALKSLGSMRHAAANEVLGEQVTKLVNGELDPEIQLDVILAAENSNSEDLTNRLEQYRSVKPEGDPTEQFRTSLRGGDAQNGRRLFYRHEGAQCARCHVVDDFGGDVGPPLNHIGSQLSREQILQSLVDPGARIAPGYGTVAFRLADGSTVRGIVQEENSTSVVIQNADGEIQELAKADIRSRENAPSSMPPMGTILSRSEIRDIVEFLANKK